MRQQRTQQVTPRWLSRASWLALVSIAWMQLSFAGHQFEHSAAYADACDVCVQVDRLDDAAAEQIVTVEFLRPVGREAIAQSEPPAGMRVVSAFHPRAPPVI